MSKRIIVQERISGKRQGDIVISHVESRSDMDYNVTMRQGAGMAGKGMPSGKYGKR